MCRRYVPRTCMRKHQQTVRQIQRRRERQASGQSDVRSVRTERSYLMTRGNVVPWGGAAEAHTARLPIVTPADWKSTANRRRRRRPRRQRRWQCPVEDKEKEEKRYRDAVGLLKPRAGKRSCACTSNVNQPHCRHCYGRWTAGCFMFYLADLWENKSVVQLVHKHAD